MKTVVLLVGLSIVLIAGSVRAGKEPELAYKPVTPKESFSIGAFKPSKTEYNFKHYDEKMVIAFLASIKDRFVDGDIIAVDGLKWQKNEDAWKPIPNPPVPVYKKGDDREEHFRRYAEWIDNHPHFGYPPLPIENKK